MAEGSMNAELSSVGIERLGLQLEELATGIREFSHAQVEAWAQLPMLALQSEGRSGYSAMNRMLYNDGLLQIVGEAEGLSGTFINCENGNVLQLHGSPDFDNLASDAQVVRAWLPNGDRFNAAAWLERYRASAVEPHRSYASRSEQEVMEWRFHTARDLGLRSVFTRVERVTVS